MSLETKIAALMAKNISKDIFNIGHFVGGFITRVTAMAVIGNLPDRFKKDIYKGEDEILISKLSTGVSILSNAGIGFGCNYFLCKGYNKPIDIADLDLHGLLVLYTTYTIFEGMTRGFMTVTPLDDKTPNHKAPGSPIGCAIFLPLYYFKEYLKNEYKESKEIVMKDYS